MNSENKPIYAMVSDSGATISSYWWRDFLELKEELTNEHNTKTAFEALDRKIFNKIKTKQPEDYMYLRNASVQYFRSNAEFIMTDFIERIIRPYQPADTSLNMNMVIERMEKLPAAENFESRFQIVPDILKTRIINRVPLTAQLDLVIKEEIDWNASVKAFIEEGVKYIKIKTDQGYEYFKKQ